MASIVSHSITQTVKFIVGATPVVSGDMVVLSAGTVIPAADSCTTGIFGVAMETGAVGEWIAIARDGVFRYMADAAMDFAPGDVVYVAGAQLIDTGAALDLSVGIVVDYDPASAGEVSIQITPSDLCPVTTHA